MRLKTAPLAAAVALVCAAAGFASAAPSSPGKTEYRIFLLARDPKVELASPEHADPIFGLVGDLRQKLESMGPKVEKKGTFNTPTEDGGVRGNAVTVWTASWDKAQYQEASTLARGIDLIQLRIEPAAAPPPRAGGKGRTPSAASVVAERVRKEIGIAVPPAMLSGDGLPFDGSRRRDSVTGDLVAAASRLDMPLASLPRDQAKLASLLKAHPAPPRAAPVAVPSPVPPGAAPVLKYDAYIEKAAADTGVDADVLRALMFAAQGYSGGFAKVTGLHGPMGLSRATGRDYGLKGADLDDPAANIAAAAKYFKSLHLMFGSNLSRSAAAFYCGSGAVRRSRGIPADCSGFVSQFYLAYQNGAAWAVNHDAPRYRRPIVVPRPVSPPEAVVRAGREDAVAAVRGDTPPNRPWHSRIMPQNLIDRITSAVTRNAFDPAVRMDPDIVVGLSWAEGGFSSGNKRPNAWGAVGPMQVTYSGAEPHCRERNAKGRLVYDWKGISQWNGMKNVECGAKVFYDRTQWTAHHDPIIGLALYNTQQKHWRRIISRDKVPPFPETVAYVVRAATIACARGGKMLLTQAHFENAAALRLARAEERRLVKDEFPYEGNEFPPECRLFR
jgi:soluble lytic murein transglycosylase-like protein